LVWGQEQRGDAERNKDRDKEEDQELEEGKKEKRRITGM
jgi:hypothetical protein